MLDSNKVKEMLTEEDVTKLCSSLQGYECHLKDTHGNPIFSTCICHGGDSEKLYYFTDSKKFFCFTCNSSYDIFELVRRAKKLETFKEAYAYVVDYFKLKDTFIENTEPQELTSDWDIFQKVQDYSQEVSFEVKTLPAIQENLLEFFCPLAAPEEWLKDNISAKVMRYYGIRVDSALEKIIIPHRDIEGRLVGIRGRSFNQKELDEGKKYMPVFIEKTMYNHPLGENLYGLYENKEVIKKIRKICIFEAEKSVLQIASMYGIKNNWSAAVCGSNISKEHFHLILSLGVEEVVVAFDADHTGKRGEPDTIEYEKKILKTVSPLLPYVNVSIIFDYDHLLPHKASPSDCGKEIFETLYHNRIRLYSYDEKMKCKKGKIKI